MIDLKKIEENVNHEPCCPHKAPHFGHCTDCYNTGCAHPPYADGDAADDIRALVNELKALRASLSADVQSIKQETSEEPHKEPDYLDDLLGIDPNNDVDRLAARAVQYRHQRTNIARRYGETEAERNELRAVIDEVFTILYDSETRVADMCDDPETTNDFLKMAQVRCGAVDRVFDVLLPHVSEDV